jgi:hypothetical protein
VRREMRIDCDAKSDSAGVRIRQHGAAQNARTRGHHSGDRGSSEITPVIKNGLVGSTGFEAPPFFSGETADSGSCSADCSALAPDLARLVAAWDQLPPAVRAGILAMVKASGG